ncbi:MAG: alpha/beta fold hydrolase [Legionellales bacterium]|nr:alpha/beta fold hydrolase [Legionellales bacterium]
MNQSSQKVTFTGALREPLSARIDWPVGGAPKAFALFAHCFSCGIDLSTVSRISRALSEENIALFRFDFTGIGSSGGDFANTNFSSNVQDLIAASQFMSQQFTPPQILLGHSLGGAAVLSAAEHIPSANAIATIGAPFAVNHVEHLFAHALEDIRQQGQAKVQIADRTFTIKKQFLDDLEQQTIVDKIGRLKRALLVMHSPVDEVVSIDNARRIYEAAKHPKSFISLDDADHLLLKSPKDSAYVARVLAAWSSRYIQ